MLDDQEFDSFVAKAPHSDTSVEEALVCLVQSGAEEIGGSLKFWLGQARILAKAKSDPNFVPGSEAHDLVISCLSKIRN